jgi:hypothetical protein
MKNIFKIFAIYPCLYLVTGCAPVAPNYPTKDLVPAGEAQAMDGTWKDKENPIALIRFEGGRAYVVNDLYNKNGNLLVQKNSIFIKNIKQTGAATYSCNYAWHFHGTTSYDNICDFRLTPEEMQYHEVANNQPGGREKYMTFVKVQLNNDSLYLASLSKTTTKDSESPSADVTSTPTQPKENKTSHEASTARPQESKPSTSNLKSTETKLVQKDKSIAYDLRGAKLGMTLSDFKALPYPDPDPDNKIRLICVNANQDSTTHPLSFIFNSTDKELDITECRWAQKNEHSRFNGYAKMSPDVFFEANLIISNLHPQNVKYRFITPPDSSEPRLYKIVALISNKYGGFDKVSEGLQSKYGKPSSVNNQQVQNKMGATFKNTIFEWKNAESNIAIDERGLDIDTMILFYIHDSLNNYYSEHSKKDETSKALDTL